MGLTDGCVLKRDLAQDTPITFEDIELPPGRLCDHLWREQLTVFGR
jgi:predicted homoserine dehydrogenase-like protein